jgi:hypothetical protein
MKLLTFLNIIFLLISSNLFAVTVQNEKVCDYLIDYYAIDPSTTTVIYVGYKLSNNNPLGTSTTQRWYSMKFDGTNAGYIQGKTTTGYNNWKIYTSTATYYPSTTMYSQDYN